MLHAPRICRFPNCRLCHPFQFALAVDEVSMDGKTKMSAERGTLLLNTKRRDFFGRCFIFNCRSCFLELNSAPRFKFPPQSVSHNPTIHNPQDPHLSVLRSAFSIQHSSSSPRRIVIFEYLAPTIRHTCSSYDGLWPRRLCTCMYVSRHK
jgi:hypothetical protein